MGMHEGECQILLDLAQELRVLGENKQKTILYRDIVDEKQAPIKRNQVSVAPLLRPAGFEGRTKCGSKCTLKCRNERSSAYS